MRRWRHLRKLASETRESEDEYGITDFDSSDPLDAHSGGLHGVFHCSHTAADGQGWQDTPALGQDLFLGNGGSGSHGDSAGVLASYPVLGVHRGIQFLLCVSRISGTFPEASATGARPKLH